MIQITDEMVAQARDLIANGDPEARGYRILIYPLDATTGMEESQKKEFGELASKMGNDGVVGFTTKTTEQADRESRGSHHGIVCSIGDECYKAKGLGDKPWLKVGEVAIFDRYTGVEVELPPGSGEMFRFTNDETTLGAMVSKKKLRWWQRGKKS